MRARRRVERDAKARIGTANVERTVDAFLAEVEPHLPGGPERRAEVLSAIHAEIHHTILLRAIARPGADVQTLAWETVAEYGEPARARPQAHGSFPRQGVPSRSGIARADA